MSRFTYLKWSLRMIRSGNTLTRYLLRREWGASDVPSESAEARADNVVEVRLGQVLVTFIEHNSVPVEMF